MKTIQEMVDIMQAYQEGKQIQIYDKIHNQWVDEEPSWNWGLHEYRIKPEPEFAPFESTEEFLEAQRKHGGGLINILEDEVINANDIYISNNGNVYQGKYTQIGYHLDPIGDLKDLFKNYKLIDHTPCGKTVEL